MPSVVEAAIVATRPFSDRLEMVGQLEAAETVVIRPEIAGVIESIEFAEGEVVDAGQELFRLRADEQRATLREAEAARALAADEFKRTAALSRQRVSAEVELDRARAEVLASEARVDRLRVNLERTEIRAPFAGALGARHVSPGDRVDPNSELVTLAAVERLKLAFTLPEAAVALARPGLLVEAEVAAYPEARFAGEVYFVSPTLHPDTRRLELKAWVANSDGSLRPGMFARVGLEVERTERALMIPESAVVYDGQGTFVWRVSSQSRAERVAVELGPRQEGFVVVHSGVGDGDTIVSGGTHKVYPGSPLRIAATDGAPAPVAAGP